MSAEAVHGLPPLRDVIAQHGLGARKALGQNFLLDLNLTAKIARAAGPLNEGTVVEIGPGPGGLTRGLIIEGANRVVAIEKDKRCIDALNPLVEASGGRLQVLEGDALETDIASLGPAPIRIVANLPYNIATPLLTSWIAGSERLHSMTLMFQKEVADRIVAQVGDGAYSRLSVLCNWRCETQLELTLPPRAFTPPPKVSSSVVTLIPRRPIPDDCRLEDLEAVTRAAFGQRRKMLRGSLKALTRNPAALLEAAGIDPTVRAETLSIDEFATLAHIYREQTR